MGTGANARLVGEVQAFGEGSDVFEENGVFFCVGSSIVITPDDREIVEATRSGDFPTLEALVESLPSGARFVARDPASDGD
jgi:hypothetical protein